MQFIGVLRPEGAGQAACSSARLQARLHPARVPARTTPALSRAEPPCLRPARHGGKRQRRAPGPQQRFNLLKQEEAFLATRCQARRRRVSSPLDALSTSAVSAGMFASRAACPARVSAARAPLRLHAPRSPVPRSPARGRLFDAGGKRRSVKLRRAALGFIEAADQSRRRTSEIHAHARVHAVAAQPQASPALRRALLAGQPKSRETERISASATTHRARATASF